MEFQKILEQDLDDIIEIEKVSHIHPWSKSVFRDCLRVSYFCDMHKVEGDIIVYGIMSIAAGESHIFNVCVNRSYRRQGYGQKMIEHLLQKSRDKKAEIAFLEVRPSNTLAIALYNKVGFVVSGVRKDYYPSQNGREDAIIMSLEL